jgi:glycerol-3-phosphate dehydrogenase
VTSLETQVVVVGGGVTGVAVLRDLALRGVPAILVDRSDFGTGTSGRWHGLLHSGARYAVRDQESARECIQENTVLRRIAAHTVEDVGGMFVLLPSDDPAYAKQFTAGCEQSGIPVEELTAAEARQREPLLADRIEAAFAVPDGGIDSWGLIRSMVADAEARGCLALQRHPVVGFERDGDRLTAVRVHDKAAGEDRLIGCQWVVNAAGAWAGRVGELAGVPIHMIAGKGVMVVMASRYVRGVVNACRKPADGDIIVPQHEVAILGTTSVQVPDPDDISVDPADVDRMVDMCAQMVPSIGHGRVLRAFAGSRPLYKPPSQQAQDGGAAGSGGDTREVSRTFTVLDHASRDGLANMFSIVGGKLTTCRQMAEHLVDQLAPRMGVTTPCTTATELLPGADHGYHQLAGPLARIEAEGAYGELVCECELVTRDQVRDAIAAGVTELEDLRRALRLGYGPCQAAFCAWRAAGALCEHADADADAEARLPDPRGALERFLQERWRGQVSAVWGDQARQTLLNQAIYRGIFDLEATGEYDEAGLFAGLAAGESAAPGPDRAAPADGGDPSRRVGDELVGESEGRAASRPAEGRATSRPAGGTA